MLDYNKFKNKILAVKEIEDETIRAYCLGKTMAHVSEKPWLMWALMSGNMELVANCLKDE